MSQLTAGQTPEETFLVKLRERAKKLEEEKFNAALTQMISKSNESPVYKKFTEAVNTKIRTASALSEVARLINPSDASLTGKSYNSFVSEKAENIFIKKGNWSGNTDENKARLQNMITNLTDPALNPKGSIAGNIVRGFLTSTPVLDLSAKLITGISTFFKAKLNKKVLEVKETIDRQALIEFQKELKPYIEFYDQALASNARFGSGIETLLTEAQMLDSLAKLALNELDANVKKTFGKPQVTFSDATSKFPFDFEKLYLGEYNPDYYALIGNIERIESIYSRVDELSLRADRLINEYISSINALVREFQSELKAAGSTTIDLKPITIKLAEYKATAAVQRNPSQKGNFKNAGVENVTFIDVAYDKNVLITDNPVDAVKLDYKSAVSSDSCCLYTSIVNLVLILGLAAWIGYVQFRIKKRV